MNINNYQQLLTLSRLFDPSDPDFTKSAALAIEDIFGIPKAEIKVFPDYSCINWKALDVSPDAPYQKKNILLKDEQKNYMGLLSIYQSNDLSAPMTPMLAGEITRLVEQALRTHLQFYKLSSNNKLLKNIVSQLPVAIILCDDNFHILQINQTAKKYLNIFHKCASIKEADKILKKHFLSGFINSGENEYPILAGNYHLQLSIRSHVINDMSKGNYTTCYQITMDCTGISKEATWNAFLAKEGLTKRECEICNLLCHGNTNDEIADSLHISVNTIKRHRENIYRKLNISRINQLNILYENSLSLK